MTDPTNEPTSEDRRNFVIGEMKIIVDEMHAMELILQDTSTMDGLLHEAYNILQILTAIRQRQLVQQHEAFADAAQMIGIKNIPQLDEVQGINGNPAEYYNHLISTMDPNLLVNYIADISYYMNERMDTYKPLAQWIVSTLSNGRHFINSGNIIDTDVFLDIVIVDGISIRDIILELIKTYFDADLEA